MTLVDCRDNVIRYKFLGEINLNKCEQNSEDILSVRFQQEASWFISYTSYHSSRISHDTSGLHHIHHRLFRHQQPLFISLWAFRTLHVGCRELDLHHQDMHVQHNSKYRTRLRDRLLCMKNMWWQWRAQCRKPSRHFQQTEVNMFCKVCKCVYHTYISIVIRVLTSLLDIVIKKNTLKYKNIYKHT